MTANGIDPLLSVRALEKHYPITDGLLRREVGRVRAVDGISFDVHRSEILGLVGESGCGKSTAARTVLRLEEPTGGRVIFDGEDIGEYDRSELKRFRRRAGMVFQDPTSSFDPRMTVGESVAEPLTTHGLRDRERRRAVAEELLERVGLTDADYDRYPHEFSGGQQQRLALARVLILNPELVIADEPVSALDVSVQAELLALLADLQRDLDLSVVCITHDLSVVREICDRVAVMYLGEIVEVGAVRELFETPQHPYTRALLSSVPTPDPRSRGQGVSLSGDVPDPASPPEGCSFHTRCPAVIQPDKYDFDQDTWRRVMDVRVALRDGDIDRRGLERIAASRRNGSKSAEVTDAELRAAVREEYDLPETGDESAEAVVSAAIEAVVAGDPNAAETHLREAFETICERRNPDRRETETGTETETDTNREVACHLYDPAVDASPHWVDERATERTRND